MVEMLVSTFGSKLLLLMAAVAVYFVVETIDRNPKSKVIEVQTGMEGNMCSYNIVNSPVNSAQLFPSGIL